VIGQQGADVDRESIVDGTVTIGGRPRRATRYAGESGGVWFVVDPDATSSTWRRAGAATARTFTPDEVRS
jgi:hypothetical protein